VAIAFNISAGGFTIRAAAARDDKALRMLLPELQNGAEYFVAVDGQHGLVVGAAGMTQSCRTQPLMGPGVSLEVIEPCRRNGIATALLANLERAAVRTFEAAALYAKTRVEKDSLESRGWQWLGFTPVETVQAHHLPTEHIEAKLGPLVERMRAKGRIPANARIVPLYEANAAAVLQMHLDQMGGERRELYRKIRGRGVAAFHPRYSCVLLVDDRVKGCILAHRVAADVAAVDANILDPSVRGGWANVWLKLEATRGAIQLGIRTFQFTTFDHYTDTRSFTEQLGGTTTRTTQLMYRPIVPRE
jgi:N-acetylglutamate synthase-like GNAT family acetyltransferase